MENHEGQPLGYCVECDRVRWLAQVGNEGGQMPRGTCRTCLREGRRGLGLGPLGPDSSQIFQSTRRTEIVEES